MKAVVMAGGEGTRLRPMTTRRPKPLAPVLNKPIIEHILELLRASGITDVVLTVHFMADAIQGCLGDGHDFGMNLIYAVEDTPLGTAGSVKLAEPYLIDEPFLIVSGDALTDVDLNAAISFHTAANADATLILKEVTNPLDFGIVVTDHDGRIQRFLEKPSWGEVFSDRVNTGMYVLDPVVFSYMDKGRPYDWSQDIFPRMLQDGRRLMGHVMEGYWCDIGSLTQYREAQYEVLDRTTSLPLPPEIAEGVWVDETAVLSEDAVITSPVMIGRGVAIKSGAKVGPYAVIGDNSVVHADSVIERSVLWDNVHVGKGSRLSGCTVCSHTTIQSDCVLEEGCVVGDKCRLESGSRVRSGVKIWPDKHIQAGATVTMSLIWGHTWQGSLFGGLGVSGIANREISPEFATRLGSAYGAFLKPGSTVMTARDSGLAARMVKRAVIAGLLSVGCNVIDLRSAPLPIMRHSLGNSAAGGGIYVRLAPDDPSSILVEMLDGDGVYLSTTAERKVESLFFREDWRRVDAASIGKLEFSGRSVEQYSEDFLRHIDVDAIRGHRFKVAVDFAFSRVASVFGGILGRLGCDVVALNAFGDPSRTPERNVDRSRLLGDLSHTVRTLRANLGAMIERDGEWLTIVDNTGEVIEGDTLLLLMAVLVARTTERASIAVPVSATSRMEGILALHGASVRRTKGDVRSVLAAAAQQRPDMEHPIAMAGDRYGGYSFPSFHNAFDAMYAVGRLMEALAKTDLTVRAIAESLPDIHIVHERLKCPGEAKGRVMITATDEAAQSGLNMDQTDGVKIIDGEAWTLVVPDAAEPTVHILSEDVSLDAARVRVEEMVGILEPVVSEALNTAPASLNGRARGNEGSME